MGCNCKETKTKDVNKPCAEANEESFRVAYKNECAKSVRYSAEAREYKNRNEIITASATKALKDMNALITNREEYIKLILISLQTRYPEIQQEILKRCGSPPISLKLGGKDVESKNSASSEAQS